MESNKNNSITLTQKRIASAKGLHLICAIAAMLLNILAFVVLAVNVTASEVMFLVFPLALSVLDVLFLVKVIFSNYRFKYAVNGAIIHSVVVLAVSVAAYAVIGMLEENNGIVFVTFALYAMLIVHVVQSIATLATALYATKSKKSATKICGMLFTIVFLICAGIYGRMLLVDGFFGQGGYTDYRTVVYRYDAQNKAYTAIDVLDGRGTDVVIPHQFNGSHVSYIDCALFAHEELTSVEVAWMDKDGCEEKLGFVGVEHLNFLNPDLKLLAPRGYMDGFRRALYTLSVENHYALDLANHVYPSDIKEDEVYISFGYDADTLALVGADNIIPVWVKAKGTEFNVKDHTNVSYIKNSDSTNASQLVWCHKYQQEQIFKCIIDAEGNEIGGVINESIVNAKVTFEKLYHLEIKADNEDADKTPIIDTYKYMWEGKEKIFDYVITTAGGMQAKLDSLPKRNGFTLTLKTASEDGGAKHEITDLASEIELLDAAGRNTLVVYPEWTLLAPSIDSITAGGSASGHVAVYGSDALLSSAATPPAEGISLKYEWFYEDGTEPIAVANEHTLKNIYPENFAGDHVKAGTYKLVVTAGADGVTKLTSTAEKTIEIGFEKKALDFIWKLPTDNQLVYSASSKNSIIEGTKYVSDDVINGDTIEYSILGNGEALNVLNAGKYDLKLELSGNTALLYEINAEKVNSSVTIKPYTLDVVWGAEDKFTYNGNKQAPTASVTGLAGADGKAEQVSIKINGAETNYAAAGYTATAQLDEANDVNKNYVLNTETTSKHFDILKRKITIQSWDKNTFVYNSKPQRPGVSAVNGLVNGESVSGDISYIGQQTNVGEGYAVIASLPEVYNYEFEGSVEYIFEITKRPLKVQLVNKETTYNGAIFESFSYTVGTASGEGVAENDKIAEIFEITYAGEAVLATDVREGGYVIDAEFTEKDKFGNYDLTYTTGTLTIKKRSVTITIANFNKTYDGEKFNNDRDIVYNVANGNIVPADEGFVFRMEYSCALNGKAGYADGVEYGIPYTITATIVADGNRAHNYIINGGQDTITAQVKMSKKTITLNINDVSSTYNGKTANINEFTYNAPDILLADRAAFNRIIYNCDALNNKNAGTYQISYYFDEESQQVTKNYEIAADPGEYVRNKKSITITLGNIAMEYNGYKPGTELINSAFNPAINNSEIVDGDDFGSPVFGGNAINAVNVKDGGYTLQIINFTGSDVSNYAFDYADIKSTLTINPRPIVVTVKDVAVLYNAASHNYTSNNVELRSVNYGEDWFVVNDTVSGLNITFKYYRNSVEVSADNVKDSGEYTVSAEVGNQNYMIRTGEEGTLTINKRTVYIVAADAEKTYDAQTYSPTKQFTAIVDGTRGDGLAAGEALASFGSFSFDGPAATATDVNKDGYEIYVTCTPDNSGIAKNYTIICDKNNAGKLTITPRTINVTVDTMPNYMYNGVAFDTSNFGITFTDNVIDASKLRGDVVYTIFNGGSIVTEAINKGNYVIKASLDLSDSYYDNYSIKFTDGELTIIARKITVTVEDATHTYDGNEAGGFKVTTDDTVINTEKLNSDVAYMIYKNNTLVGTAVNVGDYDIEARLNSNDSYYNDYDITFERGIGKLNIKPTNIDVKVGDFEIEYNGNKFDVKNLGSTIDESKLVVGDDLGTATYTIRKVSDSNIVSEAIDAGKYYVTVSYSNGNYTVICQPGTLVITKRNITVSAVATDKVYDGTNNNGKYLNAKITAGELASCDINVGQLPFGGYIISGAAVSAVNAGSYTLEVSFANHEAASQNYNIKYETAKFTIVPMEITVTPTAETRESDGTTKGGKFDYVIEGITDADEISRIKNELGTPGYGEEAENAVEAGEYELTVMFKANGNYVISCNTGKLIITAPEPENTSGTTTEPASTTATTN